MQNLTTQERIDLGTKLARAQTLVIRAFRMGIDDPVHPLAEIMTSELVELMSISTSTQRFIIVDGLEQSIQLLCERTCCGAGSAGVESTKRIEHTLHNVVIRTIERTALHDALLLSAERAIPSAA